MKIHLFNPPIHHYAKVHYRLNPALGLPIIAAVLQNAGHQVRVWDLEAMGVSPRRLGAMFADAPASQPEVVGFTVTSHNRRGARECIEALYKARYEGYIAVGGPDVTLDPEPKLDWGADVAVVGECEGNIAEIFGERRRDVVRGKPMPIEDIPGPLWRTHSPAPRAYAGNQPKIGHPEGISMWSRGCPHDCIFCGNPIFTHQRIRMRPADRIKADMADLKSLGIRSVFIYDDELVGVGEKHNGWLRGVCAEIAPLGLTWKCQGRCSVRNDKQTLVTMRKAGCRAIMWGVESFSDKVLADIKKGTTEEDIWHSLRLAHDAGIGNWVFLMVGSYKETPRDLAYTEKRFRKVVAQELVQWCQVTICTTEPGTELWRLASEEGWLAEQPKVGPQMHQIYAPTPWLSKKQIRLWRARLLRAGP